MLFKSLFQYSQLLLQLASELHSCTALLACRDTIVHSSNLGIQQPISHPNDNIYVKTMELCPNFLDLKSNAWILFVSS